jgi:hypothetical protein
VLKKSWRSAFLMSAAAVLSFTAVSAAVNILLPYLLTRDAQVIVNDPKRLSDPGDLLALALILLAALMFLVTLGAYWLYRFFGPAYFGLRGLVRWALFGALLALLLKLPDWLPPESWWLVKSVIWVLSAFIAFFVARWLVPLKTNG